MQIIGTGLSGLVGSRIKELFKDTYIFEELSRKTGTDIANKESVVNRISKSPAQIVLHMAAKTDVDGCEKDKSLGEDSEAWKINVIGTEHVISACKKENKKLIYISTDMVFNGENPLGQTYSEEDKPDPCNWYAQTKYEAEKRVIASGLPFIILRIAYPYRALFEKKEYVRIFLSLLQQGRLISAVVDNYFTPTFIDDIAIILDHLISEEETGIFHCGGGSTVSPVEVAKMVAKTFSLDARLVSATTRENFFKDRAYRPFNTALKNARIAKLGLTTRSFEEGIEEVKSQILKVKSAIQK